MPIRKDIMRKISRRARLVWPVLLWALGLFRAASCIAAPCPPAPKPASGEQSVEFAAQARDRGFLWRITRDGRSSYLYGTLHLGRADWVYPGPRLREALEASDVIALELDLSDPETLRALARPTGKPLPLNPMLQTRLDAQFEAACLPPRLLADQHPLMQASTLTLLAARWDGLDASFGQEGMLLAWAQRHARPVVALEQVQQQLAALIPAEPSEARRLLLQALDQLEAQQVREPMRRLAQAWDRGDLATLSDYEQWCDCVHDAADRRSLHRLNDARNAHLAQGIAQLHGQGKRVLAGVGALHMSGPQALPLLLGRLGFQVERLGKP